MTLLDFEDLTHPLHGKPVLWWRYSDTFAVARFEDRTGRKTAVLPAIKHSYGCRWQGPVAPTPLYRLAGLLERPVAPVLMVEGEKACEAAVVLFPDHVCLTWPGGSNAVDKADLKPLDGRDVILWPDNDGPGRTAMARLQARLQGRARHVAVVDVPQSWPPKWDVADPLPDGTTVETLQAMLPAGAVPVPQSPQIGTVGQPAARRDPSRAEAVPLPPTMDAGTTGHEMPLRRLTLVSAADLLAMQIPRRDMILAPVLPEKGLAMLYAPRGMGKTFVALGIAVAIASGGRIFGWHAPRPRRVLLIDGEMPAGTLRDRLASIIAGSDTEPAAEAIRLIADDLEPEGVPNLATEEGQRAVEAAWADTPPDLLILDNLSTLVRTGGENEGDRWEEFQRWLLSLRRRGMSALFVHHAGKSGGQRGTSRREDVLDTVIALRRPSNYGPQEGARFEVHLEKARGITGPDAEPFEASLSIVDGAARWDTQRLTDATYLRAVPMFKDGLTVREVADELGVSKTTAGRLRQRVKQEQEEADVGRA